ncbi:helicase C-terminal domain-containing protein [Lipomyces arxii]|uniref:helicase C-terminal domain-containing protein n=1 Tax=Lipomyces arxii TaxID=56418 RepID=UPI0034CF5A8F
MAESGSVSRDFHHPYEPYQIQLDFMNALYDSIENGKFGIFESPTGTGKSLSLICGAMTWLREHQVVKSIAVQDDSEPKWVREYHQNMLKEKQLRKYRDLETRLRKMREIEAKEKIAVRVKKRGLGSEANKTKRTRGQDEENFVVDDYYSDSEDNLNVGNSLEYSNISSEVQALLKKLGGGERPDDDEDEIEDSIKIFYASRTHSQLTQFVDQLRLPKFPPSDFADNQVRHVPLSSRKQLCIHPTVSRLRDLNAINDRCAELQQNTVDKRCSYLMSDQTLEHRVKTREFRDRVLADVRDIEDIAEIGKSMAVCPYYTSRGVVELGEVITLPYPLLLQPSFRKALNISLKDQIVIIDEAHNLLDAISSLFSMSISLTDILKSKSGLQVYLEKFKKKLNAGNKVYVAQILKLLAVLEVFLTGFKGQTGAEVSQNDVLQKSAVDTINVYKIERYLEKSKLARKVESYVTYVADTAELDERENKSNSRKPKRIVASVPVLSKITSFLMALTNPSNDGKVFFEQTPSDRLLKYLLLDPSFYFKSIVEEARCVILAGGTMEPVDDYLKYLVPYLPKERIQTLSCDHVIPKENLGAWTIATGPTGLDLTFTFEQQRLAAVAHELGRTIMNMCFVVPDGMVIFFPSYKYLDAVCLIWKTKTPDTTMSIWDQLNSRKQLFQEPRDAGNADSVLSEYSQAISAPPEPKTRGAILLAVVGGKMSEGINFADKLARAIVMVGLPFPNARSADMIAKRSYIERTTFDAAKARDVKLYGTESNVPTSRQRQWKQAADDASRDYYENVCMRAVNQSIGRGIRHATDYAVILFLDTRFSNPRIQNKLPKWIRDRLTTSENSHSVRQAMRSVREFFRNKE